MTEWWKNTDDWDSDDYGHLFERGESFEDPEESMDISDIDFTSIDGKTTRERLKKVKISKAKIIPKKKAVVSKRKKISREVTKVNLPSDKEIIVKGIDQFILSQDDKNVALKNIGYYKGEKLRELVLIINNDSPLDFELELFNPSEPLDYLYSTSLNLNNKIAVAGDNKVSYSDMLFNLLANPTIIPNAKFVVEGANQFNQINQPLIFKNKNIAGYEKIMPLQMALNIDIDQQQNQILYWDIQKTLGHVYAPDGMDVIKYKVLAGMQVTFGFYYKQVSLKKFFWKETRNKGIL